jgi:signal transduction histidine kinase
LQLESAQRKTFDTPQIAQERLATAIELARSALGELRRSVDGLRNDPLSGEPLLAALGRLARTFTSETGVRVTIRGPQRALELPEPTEFAIYRIVSEALSNVHRHANARRVETSVEMSDGGVIVTVADDGRGFDPQSAKGGVGILGMRERAISLGGTLQVRSGNDRGTEIVATLPIAVDA